MTLRERAEKAAKMALSDMEGLVGDDAQRRRETILATWFASECRAFAKLAVHRYAREVGTNRKHWPREERVTAAIAAAEKGSTDDRG